MGAFTLPDHLAPYDAAAPSLEDELVEDWADLMEWGWVQVDGGVEVV